MRGKIIVAITGAVMLLVLPPPAFADKPSYGCPPAFDLGGLTLEEDLQLPKTQAGLAAGAFTLEGLTSHFQIVDNNDDGIICFQSVPPSGTKPNPASVWVYNYNVEDNNASVPNG
jgi:hypothetical protein